MKNSKVVRWYEYESIISTLFYWLLDDGMILLTSEEEYYPQKTSVTADHVLFRWEGREFQIVFQVCCDSQKIKKNFYGLMLEANLDLRAICYTNNTFMQTTDYR
jgi:hypothetical protein